MKFSGNIEELFEITLNRYEAMIRRVCKSYSNEYVEADDLYQEVMVSLLLGLKSFRGRSALSTWVYRVTLNSCISFLRRDAVRFHSKTDIEKTAEIRNEDPVYGHDELDYLNYLIGKLGALDKAIILMWLEERPYKEIADVTGLSVNVVGTRLSRIRNQFHQTWQKEQESKNHDKK